MNKDRYCPTCGREIKESTRTTHEIIENISKMLKIDIWDLKGKRSHLLELENAIIKLKKQEKKE